LPIQANGRGLVAVLHSGLLMTTIRGSPRTIEIRAGPDRRKKTRTAVRVGG